MSKKQHREVDRNRVTTLVASATDTFLKKTGTDVDHDKFSMTPDSAMGARNCMKYSEVIRKRNRVTVTEATCALKGSTN